MQNGWKSVLPKCSSHMQLGCIWNTPERRFLKDIVSVDKLSNILDKILLNYQLKGYFFFHLTCWETRLVSTYNLNKVAVRKIHKKRVLNNIYLFKRRPVAIDPNTICIMVDLNPSNINRELLSIWNREKIGGMATALAVDNDVKTIIHGAIVVPVRKVA